jgi:recombinational DNA repair protein RecR
MNKINITLIPCGHLFCSECDKKRTKKECPICRKEVKDTQAIFLN